MNASALPRLTYGANGCFDDVVEWSRGIGTADGGKLIDQGWVQLALGECYYTASRDRADGRSRRLRCRRASPGRNWRAALKVFGTEGMIRAMRLMLDIIGSAGLVRWITRCALRGRIETRISQMPDQTPSAAAPPRFCAIWWHRWA